MATKVGFPFLARLNRRTNFVLLPILNNLFRERFSLNCSFDWIEKAVFEASQNMRLFCLFLIFVVLLFLHFYLWHVDSCIAFVSTSGTVCHRIDLIVVISEESKDHNKCLFVEKFVLIKRLNTLFINYF